MDSSKVYICFADQNRDYSDALRFGDIVHVTSEMAQAFHDPRRINRMYSEVRRGLRDFKGDQDYLVLVGPPLTIVMCVLTVAMKCGRANLLQWSKQARCYVPARIELGPVEIEDLLSWLPVETQQTRKVG